MPRTNSTILHPDFLTNLSRFSPQTCTIEERNQGDGTRAPGGQRIESFAPVLNHIDIPCRIAPAGGTQIKDSKGIASSRTHKILLFGHYPAIVATMRAVIAAQIYDIQVVHHDSEDKATRLDVEVII